MLHFRVHQKFVHCSCVCYGLEVHLCILPLILDLLWRELFSDFPFFIGLLLSRVGPCLIVGFPLFSPFFTPNLAAIPTIPFCCSCRGVIWPVLARPLLGLLRVHLLIGYNDLVWSLDLYSCYFGLSWPITLLVGSFGPFISPWVSLAHLLSLGILSLFFNFAFSWTFTNSFGIPWPNYLILYPSGSWDFHQPLTFLLHYFEHIVAHSRFSTSHNAHGFY